MSVRLLSRKTLSAGTLLAACIICLTVVGATAQPAAAGSNWTMRLDLRGQQIDGAPIFLSKDRVMLLGRDGHLWDFAPCEAKNYHRLSGSFHGFSASEMRAQLMREFGRKYEVTATGHYLVVHPPGQRDKWAERFEHLYRSFMHYFSARGIRPESPQFPLVAVVFASQRDFGDYVRRQGQQPGSTVLGYYSIETNRVLMFDITAGKPDSHDWHVNAETIIHEATHQTAFNTGIHSRLAATPCWVVEGLATMFEAQGIWDGRRQSKTADRVSAYWLKRFRANLARQPQGWLRPLVVGDAPFASRPDAAYSQSWAVTFYLMEKQPALYGRYLKLTADRPAAVTYKPQKRLADFSSVFGDNWTMLEARVARFTAGLPK